MVGLFSGVASFLRADRSEVGGVACLPFGKSGVETRVQHPRVGGVWGFPIGPQGLGCSRGHSNPVQQPPGSRQVGFGPTSLPM